MGDKTVSVRVRFEGGQAVKAGLQDVGREGSRAMQTIETSSNRMGSSLQNAGFQISDFFVQVSAGTAPTRALAQQMPQLLQGFGLIGVAASVLVAALPSLWSLFSSGASDAEALQKELEGVSSAVDAYSRAADLAIEPMDRLIKKYGEMAGAVREARQQQAELARGEAVRSINDLLANTATTAGVQGASSAQLAQIVALEQGYARIKALQDSLTPEQARLFDFSADLAALDQVNGRVFDLRVALRDMAAEYGVSVEQAAALAVAMDNVRNSASQGAAEQVAAATSLRDMLIEVYGSADAANEATGGLVDRLNEAVLAGADVVSATSQIAGTIGAGADEAARLADNLRAASLNYGKIQNTGQSGPDAARRSVMDLNAPGLMTGTLAGGAGGVYRAPRGGGGGGGGGGSDPDIARAKALTESLRTETEKYAMALEEVNRLKQKGLITDETYTRQLDKLNDKLGETGDLGKKAASAIRSAFDGLFDDPAQALKDLAKQLAMMALYAQLAKSFPSIFGGGGLIPLGVPGFASGGRHRGGLRIVGENGPELEATGPSMIYPNEMLQRIGRGGGGSNVQMNINNYSGGEVTTQERRGPNGQRIIDIEVTRSLSSGRQDSALRGRFGQRPSPVKR